MKKRIIIFVISLMALAILYGCCSHSDSGISVIPQGDTVVTSREVIIDELGRLPTVTFPSGAKIEGLEENTMTPGIAVTLTEQKTTFRNLAYFNDYKPLYICVYRIIALQSLQDPFPHKTYVSTIEKPLKITLPKTSISQGITLAGIKESDTDPWRFFNYSDSNEVLANDVGLRAVGTNTAENTFNLFRLGAQFALVSYGGNTGNKLPEAYVTSLIASSSSILVKDDKYLENLTIKGIFKGVKLDSIKPTDLRARITYRNNKLDEAPIKVNGINVTQTSKEDKTIPGYSYYHSFVVDSMSETNMIGTEGEFAFTLNLNGIETQSFSSGFLIEFFNKVDSEKILPYNYTEFYTLGQKEVVNIAIKVDSGKDESENDLFDLNPTFTLEIGKELGDSDKEKVEDAVSVTNIEPDKVTKDWNGKDLTIGFADELEPDSTYILSVADVTDADGISITDVEDFTFKTKPVNNAIAYTITYNLDGGIFATPNPTSYGEASETFVLNEPAKEGYTFVGWTGSNGDVPQTTVTIEQGSTGDKAYTANWSEVAYVITYNLDGGIETTNPTGYNTASETFILNSPTKVGYTFVGWSSAELTTPQVEVSIEQGSTGDKEFTANWSINSYRLDIVKGTCINTVTGDGMHEYDSVVTASCTMLEGYEFASWSGDFATETFNMPASNATMTANARPISYSIVYNLDSGQTTTDNPVNYDVTSATITLNNPTKIGYTFKGWSGTGLSGDSNITVTIPQGSTGDRNYTAHWSVNSYMLTLNKDIGINTITGDGMHEYNSVVTASCTMLDGYEFASWSGDFTTETFNMPASNATMTANARPISYSIVYNLDSGQTTTDNPVNYDVTSATITLNNPTKIGYTFKGWSGTGLAGDSNTTVTIPQGSTGDRSYTAHWSVNSYMLTLNKGTGINTVTGDGMYEYNSVVTASCTMLDGYEFALWSGDFTTETFNMPASNATMTANARPISYNIVYNLDGGNATNPTSYDITSATITLNNPTKANYAFLGWEGTGIPNGTASLTVTIPQGSTGVRSYTASYTPMYTITYNLNGGSLAIANPATYTIYSDDIVLNKPTKDGIYFMGWTSDEFFGASMSVKIPQGSTGNKTYTANWGEILTFNLPNNLTLVMHKIPAGIFIMGSPTDEPGHFDREIQHQVTITKAFYIGKFEVTQDQYFAIKSYNPSEFKEGALSGERPTISANYPVESISYNDITVDSTGFLAQINSQLASQLPDGYIFDFPTEAQWEYACRAGSITSLNNGTDITSTTGNCTNLDTLAWYSGNSAVNGNKQTHSVGQKLPNAWGLYDMLGNVWECCKDKYDSSYYETCGDCSDPVGPGTGSNRVNRGGGWNSSPSLCRSAFRTDFTPAYGSSYTGYRLVLVPAP